MASAESVAAVIEAGGAHVPELMERLEARLGELARSHGPVLAEHAQAGFEALHQLRHVRAAGLDDRRDGLRAGHQRFVPECRAMMPPAVRIQRTSARPAAASSAPSACGAGKRLTELGRYV